MPQFLYQKISLKNGLRTGGHVVIATSVLEKSITRHVSGFWVMQLLSASDHMKGFGIPGHMAILLIVFI